MSPRTSLLSFLLLALLGPALPGQGLFVDWRDRRIHPPHPPRPTGPRLPMESLAYRMDVHDARVELEVEQSFRNHTRGILEGIYVFPLPRGAVAAEFEFWMNGEAVVAEVLSRDKATQTYESIVRQVRDPGLLEYMDQDLLRARLFPIQPGQEARIRIRLAWTAERVGEAFAAELPLCIPEGRPKLTLDAHISSDQTLGAIFSPSHELDVVRKDDRHARASFEGIAESGQRRLRLYYGTTGDDPGLTLLCHKNRGPGHFLLTVYTPSTKNRERLPRDVVFVLDRSGSMKRDGKMQQAIDSLLHGIETLHEKDRFEVISFATGTRSLFGELVPATAENLGAAKEALAEVRAAGGTSLADAVFDALGRFDSRERLSLVVLLSDGEPTIGETDPDVILKETARRKQHAARIFSFGIGHDVNTKLLDRLASESHGLSDYVLPEENLELRVSTFFDRVREPVLQDVKVTVEGAQVREMFPRDLGDLFAGSAVHVAGLYRGAGKATVTLTGRVGAEPFEKTFAVQFLERCEENESLRPLFAQRKVAFLLQEIRRNGLNEELKEEVIRLGREYGIVTPWTSALVVEEGELLARQGRTWGLRFERFGIPEAEMRAGAGGLELGESVDAEDAVVRRLHALGYLESGEGAVRDAARLRRMAGDSGGVAGSDLYAFSATRPAAASKALGENVRVAPEVRHVGGRTMMFLSGVWIDRNVDEKLWEKRVRVVAYSKEYFELLAKHPELRRLFALGDAVVAQLDGVIYHVTAPEPEPEPTEGDDGAR